MILFVHVVLKLSLIFVPLFCTSVVVALEGTDGVEAQKPPQQPATDVPVPQPARPDVDNARAPESVNADDAGAAPRDQEEQANEEAETAVPDVTGGTLAQAEVKPIPGTNASRPAAPPDTPERDVAPAPRTEHAQAAEMEPADVDIDTAKPEGCTTPPPPPVHDSEGSDTQSADGRGSPMHGTQAGASVMKRDVVAASKSRLFAFRSFTRDKKVIKQPAGAADTASPDRRKAGEACTENKEKGKERRKRFWK
ncbi:hypothetical protein BDA96_03G313100 [Sorghum bicolor]|uniref:Uncharacterized protein n=1 Tax=Sorghum bicolor TaxID=4558 RepID=A0A921UP28_SORBI|nr:hypothetical protein BDA96_03G313100 [Sorghum bicolor]